MAIEPAWPADIDLLELTDETLATVGWGNGILEMLLFMYDPPRIILRLTSTQAVTASTPHTITWDDDSSTGNATGMFDPLADSKIVVTRAGMHFVIIHTPMDVDTDAVTRLIVNGTEERLEVKGHQLVMETNLAVNDELEVEVEAPDAANLLDTQTRFSVRWAGPAPV